MKHLTTLLTMAITLTGMAQQMPYNPDANGDDFVGVDDVLGVLGVYDTALMQPDLTCDYNGTDLENLMIGLIDGALILDSVYMEYLVYDTLVYFTPGCPDEVIEPLVLERGFVCDDVQSWSSDVGIFVDAVTSYFGYSRSVRFSYRSDSNTFRLSFNDYEVGQLPNFGSGSVWSSQPFVYPSCQDYIELPFPEDFELNSDGIQVHWCYGAERYEHFRLIPFWHEAE